MSLPLLLEASSLLKKAMGKSIKGTRDPFLYKQIDSGPRYKKFHETFKVCAFAMAISLVYPNRNNSNAKKIVAALVIGFNSMAIFWFTTTLIKCLLRLDIYNFTRNMTIGIVVFLFFFKSFYSFFKTDLFSGIINTINQDLLKGNELDDDYQKLYDFYISKGKLGENIWVIIPFMLVIMFPASATGYMIYRIFNGDLETRVMVHEMDLKFVEDVKYDTPYFEIIFAYNIIQCTTVGPNFCGFDGFFCITTTHICLKLETMALKLAKAFQDSRNHYELEERVKEAIKDHQQALEFYNLVQEAFGGWLFVAFLLTSTVISFNLYLLSLSGGLDPIYTIFGLCGVVHMFAPCHFASDLIQVGNKVCMAIYGLPWESSGNPKVTRLLIFMIARQQPDMVLTGKGVVIYNMELFVSIMQSSYSFFTLMRS